MRVAFLGTPAFAVPVLITVAQAGHEIVAVITQPDKRRGRRGAPAPSPVKQAAIELGLSVLQFTKIKSEEASAQLEDLGADILLTAAYGQILSRRNLDAAPLGVVNAHASLLPGYRGPAPVNWCLINGETRTGVTIMHTDVGVDDGDIILQEDTEIRPFETADQLLERLSHIAGPLMVQALSQLEAGTAPRIPQNPAQVSRHPMLQKEDGRLDFSVSAQAVSHRACGVTPWPGAFSELDGQVWKFMDVRPVQGKGTPGTVLEANSQSGLVVACGEGAVRMGQIQIPGKRMMPAADFFRGRTLLPGARFGA